MKEREDTDVQGTTNTLLLQIGDPTRHGLAAPPPCPWHNADPHSGTGQQVQGRAGIHALHRASGQDEPQREKLHGTDSAGQRKTGVRRELVCTVPSPWQGRSSTFSPAQCIVPGVRARNYPGEKGPGLGATEGQACATWIHKDLPWKHQKYQVPSHSRKYCPAQASSLSWVGRRRYPEIHQPNKTHA